MAGIFEEWVRGWRLGFNGPNFRAFMGGLAAVMDRADTIAKQATREGYAALAEDAASLGMIGADYGIERGPTETVAEFQARLAYKVALNRLRGTPLGVLLALYYGEFEGAVLVQQNGRYHTLSAAPNLDDIVEMTSLPSWVESDDTSTRPSDGAPWWTFDDSDTFCSRFAVIFPVDAPNPGLSTAATLARAQRLVKAWRPAKATCEGFVHVTAGKTIGYPVRLIDNGSDIGPSTTAVYSAG